jgi:two-component system CitB family sensor kinase
LLRLSDVTGRQFSTLRVPAPVTDLVGDYSGAPTKTVRVVVDHSVLLVSGRHVVRGNRDLGWVITVLDRTQVEQLTQQLDAVGALSTALRVQRHEFANRLHTIAGLLHLGDVDEAARFVRHTIDSGPLKFPVEHADRLQDPYLQAFLGAKGFELAERGVLLRIGAETLLTRPVDDPEDLTTVLGNLIDNATEAAVRASGEERWVEVELMNDDQVLHVVVADSGDGIAGNQDLPFAEGHSTRAPGASDGHGQGLGLPLSRRIARNRGGDVWLADPGAPGGPGAVFCARLPGILGTGALEEAERA